MRNMVMHPKPRRQAAQILQERHIASNPMKAYAKACTNQIAGHEEQQSRLKKADDNRTSWLLRTACL